MSTRTSMLDALRWVAGAAVEAPAPQELLDLLPAIARHRITARALARLDELPPGPATASLRSALEAQWQPVRAKIGRQLAAAAELDRAWGTTGSRPVLFKGNSAYLSTGSRTHLRAAGDVDVVVDDPNRLRTLLPTLGYEEIRFHESGHEIGLWRRDDVLLEPHRFSPLCWVPRTGGAPPFRHDGRVSAEQFAANSTRRPVPESDGSVVVPTPSLGLLIACANVYKDYALNGYPRPAGTAPLGFLAEAVDLAAHPDFSAERFTELVGEVRAGVAVAFVESLLDHHGLPVPAALRAAAETGVPAVRNLGVGFTFVDERPGAHARLLDDLVLRGTTYADYLGCLPGATVRVDDTSPVTSPPPSAGVREGRLDLRFRVATAAAQGLAVDVEVRNGGSDFEVLLDFGDRCAWGTRDDTGKVLGARLYEKLTKTNGKRFGEAAAEIHEEDGVSRFRLTVPRVLFADEVRDGRLAALLGVRLSTGDATAIPLDLVFQS